MLNALIETGNRACDELEGIYKGLKQNQYYQEIKRDILSDL